MSFVFFLIADISGDIVYYVMKRSLVQCSAALCCAVLCCTVQCCIVQCRERNCDLRFVTGVVDRNIDNLFFVVACLVGWFFLTLLSAGVAALCNGLWSSVASLYLT